MKLEQKASIMAKEIEAEIVITEVRRTLLRIHVFCFFVWLASRICPLRLYVVWPYDKEFRCAAGLECNFTEPYGWVPEAGCPVHDPESNGDAAN